MIFGIIVLLLQVMALYAGWRALRASSATLTQPIRDSVVVETCERSQCGRYRVFDVRISQSG